MKYVTFICALLASLSVAVGQNHERVTIKVTQRQLEKCPDGPFEADWDSLRENSHVPEWFKDAKFGIFIHWGG